MGTVLKPAVRVVTDWKKRDQKQSLPLQPMQNDPRLRPEESKGSGIIRPAVMINEMRDCTLSLRGRCGAKRRDLRCSS